MKEYNPCGGYLGNEREICELARSYYSNLPYTQVIRNVVLANLNDDLPYVSEWLNRDLNEIEKTIVVDLSNFTPAIASVAKFYIHLLYENRYNIYYNRLEDFSNNIGNVPSDLIDVIAKNADYSMSFNDIFDELCLRIKSS